MPTYQYECEACGHCFEELQSMMDKKLRKCPKCSKLKLFRLIGSGAGVIFKGSGFYETDYKKKTPSSESKSSESKPSESTAGDSCGKGTSCVHKSTDKPSTKSKS